MPTTPIGGLPYPATSDSPNGPLQIQNLAAAVDGQLVPRFATTAARDAAITAPANGMVCWCESPGAFYERMDGAWRIRQGATLDWVTPTLAAGWRQDPPGRTFAYAKDAGWVNFRGMIAPAVGTTKSDPTPTVFTLPAGFRPQQETFQPVFLSASPFVANVGITVSGAVRLVFFTGTVHEGVVFGFDGVRFFVGS